MQWLALRLQLSIFIVLLHLIWFFVDDFWEIIRVERTVFALRVVVMRRLQLVVEYIVLITLERSERSSGIRRMPPVMTSREFIFIV